MMDLPQDVQAQVPQGRIDLGVGQPDPALLPLAELREAAAKRLAGSDWSLLAYGVQQGGNRFRRALAGFLSQHYGCPVATEQLFIVAGASDGIDTVARSLADPGDTVFVEDPSYFCALRIFEDHKLNLVTVPTDEQGLSTDALAQLLRKKRPKFLYTVPVYHNPCGTTLPETRRKRLLELAREYDFRILADEVYQLLGYEGATPPPLVALDPELNHVISVGAFTKILAPGLRLGWLQASGTFCKSLAQAGVRFSGGGNSPFTCEIVRACLEEGLQQSYLTRLKGSLKQRAQALAATLRQGLPNSVHFTDPKGGYFLWLRLPKNLDSEALLPLAQQSGVGYRAGAIFSADGGHRHCLRVGFSYYDIPLLQQGAERLCQLLNQQL